MLQQFIPTCSVRLGAICEIVGEVGGDVSQHEELATALAAKKGASVTAISIGGPGELDAGLELQLDSRPRMPRAKAYLASKATVIPAMTLSPALVVSTTSTGSIPASPKSPLGQAQAPHSRSPNRTYRAGQMNSREDDVPANIQKSADMSLASLT